MRAIRFGTLGVMLSSLHGDATLVVDRVKPLLRCQGKMLIAMLLACTGKPGIDSGPTEPTYDCEGNGDSTVVIGQGAASEFNVLDEGAAVGLDVAPQGGFGVSIRARTTGLVADDIVDVLLVTEIDGAEAGSFLNEATNLFCQDDGTGMLWGAVVGFDPDVFKTNEDLLELNGQQVNLVVTVTDSGGDSATGEIGVIIVVGG